MIELLKSTRKFDVENLKQVRENLCINYSEKLQRYTFYHMHSDGHIAESYVSVEMFELMKNFGEL